MNSFRYWGMGLMVIQLIPKRLTIYIHIAHGGDHGKGKLRFELLLCMKDGDSFTEVYGLADVKCKKDHSIILDNTVMPHLIPGVNKIELGNIVFT
jgi:hypothetical protein